VRLQGGKDLPTKLGTFKVDINDKICEILPALINASFGSGG
jgi:hypothetical protein